MNITNTLHFSDKLAKLRREKKITQEELANFVGVTKASVSKWETGQSLPDILLLPLLASFFQISIDDLIGYEPQLSSEQIQKIYQTLAKDFSRQPFESVIEESRTLVKKYYSCYPFLLQIGILWLNHASLAKDTNRQKEILESAVKLCRHILDGCKDAKITGNAFMLKAILDLQCGRISEAVEALEDHLNPNHMVMQGDACLIQAYQMAGEHKKAIRYTQVSIYAHLHSMISSLIQYLLIHAGDAELCKETLKRADNVAEIFHLDKLNPNLSANLSYAAAIAYCAQNQPEQALARLKQYVKDVRFLLQDENLTPHGDAFFDEMDFWFSELDLGASAPRYRDIVKRSLSDTFSHPAFTVLETFTEFQKMKEGVLS